MEVFLIPNESDNLHCLQSCFAMINNAIFNQAMSAVDAEIPTGYEINKPTWQYAALKSFADKGLAVRDIESFPISDFIKNPIKTIKEHYSDQQVVDYIINNTDFEKEIDLIKSSIQTGKVKFIQRTPEYQDIIKYLDDNWYLFCNVNYYSLLGQNDKYAGHFVVIERVEDDFLILQNPGLPPIERQKVSKENFLKAWNYPDEKAANLYAVKK